MVMRRRRPSDASQGKAEVLVEALPWINEWAGSTFVVKYGGSAMEDATLRAKVIEDVLLLKLMGVHVVLVHGGKLSAKVQNCANVPCLTESMLYPFVLIRWSVTK
mgnify:CR=1 FL=1